MKQSSLMKLIPISKNPDSTLAEFEQAVLFYADDVNSLHIRATMYHSATEEGGLVWLTKSD